MQKGREMGGASDLPPWPPGFRGGGRTDLGLGTGGREEKGWDSICKRDVTIQTGKGLSQPQVIREREQ